MARPPRPSDRRGDGRDRAASRRPGEASGPIRRSPQRGRARGESSSDAARRQSPQRRSPSRDRERPAGAAVPPGRVGTTAHPEAHRLTTRTDLSDTVLGPRNYTPRRIGLLAVVAIILLVTVSFPLRNHYQYRSEERAVAQERAALEATIAELEAEQDMLADPAYIEQQARIRFGAVRPGETPYRVATEDPVERAVAEQRAAELAALPWHTRVWDSISQPQDPIFPESSSLPDGTSVLEGTSIPGGPDTPAVPVGPDGLQPDQPQPEGAPDGAAPPQQQEDPPA